MFEWLEREISAIKTPRFHVVDGPSDMRLKEMVNRSTLPLPSSYKEFVLKFGNAKLYRRAKNESYRIGVFAGPRRATLGDGTLVYHLGFHDGASVYVKPGIAAAEVPVFEFEAVSGESMAGSFEEWLTESCIRERSSYSKVRWAEILNGPKPFTAEEMESVEARRLFRWRVLEIDSNGNHVLEILNCGGRTLPLLTLGVRSRDRRLNGAIHLKVDHIGSGQMSILHVACYKGIVLPDDIEIFSLPDPQPEDRERYPELR